MWLITYICKSNFESVIFPLGALRLIPVHSCVKNVMNDVSSLGRFLLPDITTVRPDCCY